jgi:hypothetical protein
MTLGWDVDQQSLMLLVTQAEIQRKIPNHEKGIKNKASVDRAHKFGLTSLHQFYLLSNTSSACSP